MERVEPQDLPMRTLNVAVTGGDSKSHEKKPFAINTHDCQRESFPGSPCFLCFFPGVSAWTPRCVLDRIWQRVDLPLHNVAPRSSARHPGKLPPWNRAPRPNRQNPRRTPRCHGKTRPRCHGRAQHLVILRRWKAREPSSGPKHPRPSQTMARCWKFVLIKYRP